MESDATLSDAPPSPLSKKPRFGIIAPQKPSSTRKSVRLSVAKVKTDGTADSIEILMNRKESGKNQFESMEGEENGEEEMDFESGGLNGVKLGEFE